jgi:uncharacterized protein (TIGR03382 family)
MPQHNPHPTSILRFTVAVLVSLALILSTGSAFAEDPPPGSPGGACLEGGTCQGGAQCYKRPDGATICLLPATGVEGNNNNTTTGNTNNILQNCPPQHRYLACPPNGGTCQLRCVYPKGFGCQQTPTDPSLWLVLSLVLLGWLLRRR